ncbi:hypothetical protein E4T50_00331 [Aureobasidium sp. EXF-12298]|nr:hypothetical protein E4T50_00331 [Aureobasidium sp. EXF-12298]KAI4764660.1 hypothetical protein E4T51_02384 [Aureobasidium sp. EXF-12344]KAI4784718.1 hypothetical protein E4T52_00409 [Aureobasidium sp. EXF-3400]
MDKRPRLQNHECQHLRAQRQHVHGHLHLVLKSRANVPEREFVAYASNTVIIQVKCLMKNPPPRSEAPTTPGTHDGYGTPVDIENFDEIRAMPRPEPQRAGSYQYEAPRIVGTASRQTELRLDTAMTGVRNTNNNLSVSTFGTLPFRAMTQPDGVPLASPGLVTKTTYLERRRDMLSAPRTGMATPYSPYMPFTPVTPVTPHLTSRAERRQRERDQGRRAPAALDQVIDEEEMWGSGY